MIQSISWQQYILFLVISLFIYYLLIWVILYKCKLVRLSNTDSVGNISYGGEDAPDEMLQTAQEVIAAMRPLFKGRRNQHELLQALKEPLQRFAVWEEEGFRDIITAFIIRESQITCSLRLSEEDLRVLWV